MRRFFVGAVAVLSMQAFAGTGNVTRLNFGFLKPATNSTADVNVVLFYSPSGSYSTWSITYWPGTSWLRFTNSATGKCTTYVGDWSGAGVFQSACDANNPNQRFVQQCASLEGPVYCQIKTVSGLNCLSATTPYPAMLEQPLKSVACLNIMTWPETQLWRYPSP